MIAPGVPDMQSMRGLLEMGYEIHEEGPMWPIYDLSNFDYADWADKKVWPAYIHNQWQRVGVKKYQSPDSKRIKEVVI